MEAIDFKFPDSDDWIKEAQKQLKDKPVADLYHHTTEDIILKPIYFGVDRPTIENTSLSTVVHIAPVLCAPGKQFNAMAKKALAAGQTALTIDLDLTSQFAATAVSNPQPYGLIHLTEYNHFERLFEGIDLENVPLFFDAFLKSDTLFEHYYKYAVAKGYQPQRLVGALGADPLGGALVYGGFPAAAGEIFSKLAAVYNAKKDFTALDIITVSAASVHNSGGHAIQELSYVLSTIVYYVEQLKSLGVNPQQTLSALRVKLAVGNEQFKEIAKLRALRLLWNNLCRAYDIKSDIALKIDVVTSWRFLSSRDIYNNMLRCSSQVFSALIGGCNSINILPFDLATGKTSDSSRRTARNTAIILMEESHLNKVKDPSLGSAFIDSFTFELAAKAWQAFGDTEQQGGILKLLANGEFQSAIEQSASRQIDAYKKGSKKALGLNFYKNENEQQAQSSKGVLTEHIKTFTDIELHTQIKPLSQARLDEYYEN